MSLKDTIPECYYKGDAEKPHAATVGELKQLLGQLPDDLPIMQGFGQGVNLCVYNVKCHTAHLSFDDEYDD